jgi:acylphosphatase
MSETLRIARRCIVSGRVQGVAYRATARARAWQMQIYGYARNLPDGRVEVLACGQASAVQAFIEWLWIGPAAARVSAVQVEEVGMSPARQPPDFAVE